MAKAVIVSAVRTAVGSLGGALAQQPATKLGAIAVREAIQRAKLTPEQVDEVILGHVLPAGLGLNPARVAAIEVGCPEREDRPSASTRRAARGSRRPSSRRSPSCWATPTSSSPAGWRA